MTRDNPWLRAAVLSAALAAANTAGAATQVLYGPPGTDSDPTQTGWLAGSLFLSSASFSAAGVSLAPLAGNASLAGYSNHSAALVLDPLAPKVNPAFPVLDSAVGYRLSFGMDLDAESHTGNDNRAGFSVTLIGHDRRGVEIGFQNDRIFAQSLSGNSFVAAEHTTVASFVQAAFAANRWDLDVLGQTYTLRLGGQTALSGPTRDFSSYAGTGQNAYRTPDFVFFGDNTSSAQASFTFSYAAVTTPVPEPGSGLMLAAGLGAIAWFARRAQGVRRGDGSGGRSRQEAGGASDGSSADT